MEFHHDLSDFGTLFSTTATLASPMHQAVTSGSPHEGVLALRPKPRRVAGRLIALLLTWSERVRQRRALASMSPRMLADIGVRRELAAIEAQKPFWQA